MQEWANFYYSIEKKTVISEDEALQQVKTVDDAITYTFAKALHSAQVTMVDDVMQALKANNIFKYAQDYSRYRKNIKQVTNVSGMMHEAEPAQELDEKVKAVVDGLTHKLS